MILDLTLVAAKCLWRSASWKARTHSTSMPKARGKVALIMFVVSGGCRGWLSRWVLVDDVKDECDRRWSVQVGVYR